MLDDVPTVQGTKRDHLYSSGARTYYFGADCDTRKGVIYRDCSRNVASHQGIQIREQNYDTLEDEKLPRMVAKTFVSRTKQER